MNAIVLMVVGDRHAKHLGAVRESFAEYASFCNADLVVCDTPPDPRFKRNIIAQKLLFPSLYKQYEWLACFDIDILISRNAPSIFDYTDDRSAFAAVVDPRGSLKFRQFWRQPAILEETHESYFSDRGFPTHSNPKASINGGVWLCRPKGIHEQFREIYFSDLGAPTNNPRHDQGDEALLAYASQKAGLFFELNYKWNTQIIYEIFTPAGSPVVREVESGSFKRLRGYSAHSFPTPDMYPPAYVDLVNQTLANCYLLHFSAGYPFVNIRSDLTFTAGRWPTSASEAGGSIHRAARTFSYLSRRTLGRLRKKVQRMGSGVKRV